MKSPTIAIALSGGVDSLVSGFLIKQAYKNVFGIHFTTGYETNPVDTRLLETQLGFPVHTMDLTQAFEADVVQYFISTYLAGKTPNPCIACNQKIKFGHLLTHALSLGADALATGHYATIINKFSFPDQDISHSYLEKGTDPNKDQSYFLSMLRSHQLDKLIFPLAAMTKTRVKEMAKKNNLVPAVPSESQDICFIPERSFADFINQKLKTTPKPGNIVDINGKIVGTHNGLHTFTVGQRRGINAPAAEPYYVRQINMANNTLEVCFKKDLARTTMEVDKIIWNYPETKDIHTITTKIRYSHKGAVSHLTRTGNRGKVVFETPQNAITPGQAAVFYEGNRVAGAGIIQ